MLPLYDYSMKAAFWRRANRTAADGTAPLFLRVTIAKQRAEIASGIDVPEAYWNVQTHAIEAPENKSLRLSFYSAERIRELNARLTELKYAADQAYQHLRKTAPPTARQILEAVRGLAQPEKPVLTFAQAGVQFLAAMQGPGIGKSANTVATYRSRLDNLQEFFTHAQRNKGFLLRDATLPVARALERWCLAQLRADGLPRFGHAAMAKQVNMLQMVVAWGAMEGYVPTNALHGYKYQSTPEPTRPRYLPAADVALLQATVFTSDYLNNTADMWVFCCYTALSYVDYCQFAADPLAYLSTDTQGREWIRMTRQKMRKRKPEGFSVPFFPEARAIFERRRGRLPVRQNSDANKTLKEIASELNLSLPDLTFKDSRSTFAQRWRDAGVSGAVVAAMMGDEERVVNKSYAKIREQTVLNELSRLNLLAA